MIHTHSINSYTECQITKGENLSSIRKFRLCVVVALADVPLPLMTFQTRNNHLQSSMFECLFPFGSWIERHRK